MSERQRAPPTAVGRLLAVAPLGAAAAVDGAAEEGLAVGCGATSGLRSVVAAVEAAAADRLQREWLPEGAAVDGARTVARRSTVELESDLGCTAPAKLMYLHVV